jgi:hypothetical protein
MIYFDPGFPDIIEKKLTQTEQFLDNIGIARSSYLIAPDSAELTNNFLGQKLVYEHNKFDENDLKTNIQINLTGFSASATMGFRDSLMFLCFTFEQPSFAALLRNVDKNANPKQSINAFQLEEWRLQASVKAGEQGVFLAPEGKIMCVFSVDTHGEVTRIAETETPLLAALILRVFIDIPSSGIASRRARFMPD